MAMLRDLPNFERVVFLTTSVTRRLNTHSFTALAGMAAPVVLAAGDWTSAATAHNYNFIRDSISSLALTDHGYIQVIGFMAAGLLIEIFIAGLLYNIRHDRGYHLGIAAMVLFGFFMLLVGAFRTDPAGAVTRSTDGVIHGLSASLTFWLFPIGLFLMGRSIKRDTAWSSLFPYTIIAGVLGAVLAFLAIYLNHRIDWFGLLERLVVINMILWVEIAAFRMLLLSMKMVEGRHGMARWKP